MVFQPKESLTKITVAVEIGGLYRSCGCGSCSGYLVGTTSGPWQDTCGCSCVVMVVEEVVTLCLLYMRLYLWLFDRLCGICGSLTDFVAAFAASWRLSFSTVCCPRLVWDKFRPLCSVATSLLLLFRQQPHEWSDCSYKRVSLMMLCHCWMGVPLLNGWATPENIVPRSHHFST